MVEQADRVADNRPLVSPPTAAKLSSKASAFSIAAIIGETSLSRSSDNVSPPAEDCLSDNISDVSMSDSESLKEGYGSVSEQSVSPCVRAETPPCCAAMADVTSRLETRELWEKFHELGTEMIITKTGRRMFPTVRVSFGGLDPTARYVVHMDIVPLDKKRYRYAYHRSSWLVAGKADPPPISRLHMHPDGAFTGEQLMKQTVSFEKMKVTNNPMDRNGSGHIILNSMHKYQPRIHLVKLSASTTIPLTSLDGEDHRTFVYPETVFIGVTAYQNQLITKLKIDSNPFAKGFRDSSRLSEFERETMEGMLQGHSYSRSPFQMMPDPLELEETLRQTEEYHQKALSERLSPWRPVATSPPSPSTSLHASFPVSSANMSLFSLYGSMLTSQSLYNQELLLRSQLYKGHVHAGTVPGLYHKHLTRHHPYLPSEKIRDATS